jgi:glycosyltransferase involved in cell wall biosynthesis
MRIALVHDYLMQDGGAERVLLALHELYPDAPIFTLFHDPERSHPDFRNARIVASSLNNLPFAQSHYEWYLPLMPHGIESFDLADYDVVISSSSNFAKGALADPYATHICYCHTPNRFLWEERLGYLHHLKKPGIIKKILPYYLHHLRQWDHLAAERPDHLITNSAISRARIQRYYRRDASIIYPPVDIDRIQPSEKTGSFWLTGGRLVPYKRFDLVVTAFAHLNLPLKIFGTGPEEKRLRALAGPRTEFLGHVDEKTKIELYQNAIAFFYPQIEDFGITAVEAMAAGKPVIAYNEGGVRETVVDGITGQVFNKQCWEDIGNLVIRFDASRFPPAVIRSHAERFSKERFQQAMKQTVDEVHQKRMMLV